MPDPYSRAGRVRLHLAALVWGQPLGFVRRELFHLRGIAREICPQPSAAMTDKTRQQISSVVPMISLALAAGNVLVIVAFFLGSLRPQLHAMQTTLGTHSAQIGGLATDVVRIDRDGAAANNTALSSERLAAAELKAAVRELQVEAAATGRQIATMRADIGYLVEAAKRAESRSGYTPPPAP